jgi:hypothetical protein
MAATTGCSLTQDNPRQSNTGTGSSRTPQKPGSTANSQTANARRNQVAVDPANAGPALEAWAKAFSDWAGGTRPPQTASTATPVQRKPVYVNVMAVARRHPAWQLADDLQRNVAPAQNAVSIDAPRLPGGDAWSVRLAPLAPLSPLNTSRFDAARTALPRPEYSLPAVGSLPLTALTTQAEQRVTASGLSTLQEYSRQRQRAAIESFLEAAEQRSEIEVEGRSLDLRGALEENIAAEVEAFERLALAPTTPPMPSSAVQLEMTNLRLRLQIERLTPAEREQARARLNELEAQWLEELRAQEAAQLAQLEQSRRELPLQRRREGSVAVNQALNQLRSANQQEREAVRARLLTLLGQDFGQDEATLGIVLPPVVSPFDAFPPNSSASTRFAGRSTTPGRMIFETPAWGAASNPEISSGSDFLQQLPIRSNSRSNGSTPSGFPAAPPIVQSALAQRKAQIGALRAQAIREAGLWTRIVARRQGWQLQEVRPERVAPQTARGTTSKATPTAKAPVTDGTSTVLRILNFV